MVSSWRLVLAVTGCCAGGCGRPQVWGGGVGKMEAAAWGPCVPMSRAVVKCGMRFLDQSRPYRRYYPGSYYYTKKGIHMGAPTYTRISILVKLIV